VPRFAESGSYGTADGAIRFGVGGQRKIPTLKNQGWGTRGKDLGGGGFFTPFERRTGFGMTCFEFFGGLCRLGGVVIAPGSRHRAACVHKWGRREKPAAPVGMIEKAGVWPSLRATMPRDQLSL
jgi:hypothetical protein